MALVETYVDPDATGTGTGVDWTNAYTSLNAWEAAEQTDLVADGNNHTVHLRSSAGGDDTTAVTITGWTTDATHLITVTQDDFPADGVLDETKYLLFNNDARPRTLDIQNEFVNIDKLQLKTVAAGTASRTLNYKGTGSQNLNMSKCILFGSGLPAYALIYDTNGIVSVVNAIITGHGVGVLPYSATTGMFNATVYGCTTGIAQGSGTVTATNCAVGNNTDDFSGTITVDHCCSDDGDGTNAQGPLSGSWANEFTDAANGDFSLVSGGNCIDNGTNTGAPSEDIIGTARPQNVTTDIGAYEFLASTGIVILRRRRSA